MLLTSSKGTQICARWEGLKELKGPVHLGCIQRVVRQNYRGDLRMVQVVMDNLIFIF